MIEPGIVIGQRTNSAVSSQTPPALPVLYPGQGYVAGVRDTGDHHEEPPWKIPDSRRSQDWDSLRESMGRLPRIGGNRSERIRRGVTSGRFALQIAVYGRAILERDLWPAHA